MPIDTHIQDQTRRAFVRSTLGTMFLAVTLPKNWNSANAASGEQNGPAHPTLIRDPATPLSPVPPPIRARARRVIYLHMVGGPSQFELFEHKPDLTKYDGADCPRSFLEGKQFAFIRGAPKLLGSQFPFSRAGQSDTWISDRLPYLAKHVDDLCFIHSMRTDQFNHAPALSAILTGDARAGAASLGSWITYGLGTENQNLPGFVVLVSGIGSVSKQLWSSGFLPGAYQGVLAGSGDNPVPYLRNPRGVSRAQRRRVLDTLAAVNQQTYDELRDPETLTRISQYEMAYRMQTEASDVFDIRKEPEHVRLSYGAKPGEASFANNCLVARRLAERGVRFIQLLDGGWDSHGIGAVDAINIGFKERCRSVDQPIAALLGDLKVRGLLEDTMVVWGGEFGRTPMRETRETLQFVGRDHQPHAFTIWLTGGGIKPAMSYGETDELGYDVVRNPVEVRDLHATLLYALGFDHRHLSYPFQGLEQRLTGVKEARVVADILS